MKSSNRDEIIEKEKKLRKKINRKKRYKQIKRRKEKKEGVVKAIPVRELSEEEKNFIQKSLSFMGSRYKEYYEPLLTEMVRNYTIPASLLSDVPKQPGDIGKTRFDQLYDASMELAFPGYSKQVIDELFGDGNANPFIRIWRVIIPQEYGIANVLIRAETYQDAFALACDYVCRTHLRIHGKIPSDISIRVMFMSDGSMRRFLSFRVANKMNGRKKYNLIGRELSLKQMYGARMFALGHLRNNPRRSLAKYVENKEMTRLKNTKTSGVESETLTEKVESSVKEHERRRELRKKSESELFLGADFPAFKKSKAKKE